jgi:hypothetical protein
VTLYCVDTSAWVDVVRDYNPASTLFVPFWKFVEENIGSGNICSPEEVLIELKAKTLEPPEFQSFINRVEPTPSVGCRAPSLRVARRTQSGAWYVARSRDGRKQVS